MIARVAFFSKSATKERKAQRSRSHSAGWRSVLPLSITAKLSSPNLIRIWRTWPIYIDWCKNRVEDLCHWIVSSVSVSSLSRSRWDFVSKWKSCTAVRTKFFGWAYVILIWVDQLKYLLMCIEPELRRSLRGYPNKLDDEKLNWQGIHPQMLRDPIDI